MNLTAEELQLLGYIFEDGVSCYEEEEPIYPAEFGEERFWEVANSIREKIREAQSARPE